MSTSKQISWVCIFAYIIQVSFTGVIKTKYNIDISPLLNYTTPLIGLVFTFYFGKSGLENYVSLKNDVNNILNNQTQSEGNQEVK